MYKNWMTELQQDAPVNLSVFVERMGLKASLSEMPGQIVGYMDTKRIKLNKKLDRITQRHVLSFLLAHVHMHKDYITHGSHVSHLLDSTLGHIPDQNARSLATRILMPDHLIETYLSDLDIEREKLSYGHKQFKQLSKLFGVSQLDLAKRLNVIVPFKMNGLAHG